MQQWQLAMTPKPPQVLAMFYLFMRLDNPSGTLSMRSQQPFGNTAFGRTATHAGVPGLQQTSCLSVLDNLLAIVISVISNFEGATTATGAVTDMISR